MNDIENSKSPLELKSIQDLLDEKYQFYVPGYQRGYRWREDEVKTLILDINRFVLEEDDKAVKDRCPFYCLQSLVIKQNGNRYEVIDGQQRLTTILIILQAIHTLQNLDSWNDRLADRATDESFVFPVISNLVCKDLYTIKYETRKESNDWLKEITQAYIIDNFSSDSTNSEKLKDKNADYYHFVDAFKTSIDTLIDLGKDSQFRRSLTGRTRLIWYNTSLLAIKSEDVDIFDDLNATKIALNNAELIKALFLQKENFNEKTYLRDQKAIDWDNIEKKLQDPSFWGFVYSSRHPFRYSTHIEYIFDLISKKSKKDEDYYYYTFNYYHNKYIISDKKLDFVNKEWEEVKKMMLALEEWYNNKTCYHYIGYLLEYGMKENSNSPIDIPYLVWKLREISKSKRTEVLKSMVKDSLKGISPSQLFHDSSENKKKLTQVLFLLNIQTEENRVSDTARFSFSKYKEIQESPGWNQEHVASNTDYTVKYEERIGLAQALLEYFTGIRMKLVNNNFETYKSEVIKNYPDDPEAKKLCDRIFEFFQYTDSDDNINTMNVLLGDVINYFSNDHDDEFKVQVQVGKSTKNEKDFIWNFALLNATTNKSYGNDIFPLKRRRIMSDEESIYTPICTRGMFEKAYSKKLSNLLAWGRKDGLDFWNYVCNTLSEFLPDKFNLPFNF